MTERWSPPGWVKPAKRARADLNWHRATRALRGITAAVIAEMEMTPAQVEERLARGEEVVVYDGDGNRVGSFLPIFVNGRYVTPPSVVAARLKRKTQPKQARERITPQQPARNNSGRKTPMIGNWTPPNWATQPTPGRPKMSQLNLEELAQLAAEARATRALAGIGRGFIGNAVHLPHHSRMSEFDPMRIMG